MSERSWTHVVKIATVDELSNKMHVEICRGEGKGQSIVAAYPMLSTVEGLEGKTVLADMDFKDKWINRIHPGRTAVDAVSLSIMRMLGSPFEDLKNAWLATTTQSPQQSFLCNDGNAGSLISYNGRRYHWKGKNKGLKFDVNEISFEAETPETILTAVRLRPLRDVVDHPGIPKRAIATKAWCRLGVTYVAYDVEDVDMEEVFGPIARQAWKEENHEEEGKMK
tara:strand:+ start:3282 stop:3950 length:669 start_codon:yes stop_codon:yes gene_type:complete